MAFENYLKNLINHTGSLSVADFMNEVLFNPKYGYYQKNLAIGKKADFITAPEISQVFGEIITSYLLNFFTSKNPDLNNSKLNISLVEMGAGRGTLIKDILISLKKLADNDVIDAKYFLQFVSFNIIEISPKLQKIQKENLQKVALGANITINWYQDFEEFLALNNNQEIYFIANELFDCFAINQFIMVNKEPDNQHLWHEIRVTLERKDQAEDFKFFRADFNPAIHKLVAKLVADEILDRDASLKEGAVFEYSFAAVNFMKKLASHIKNNSGLALIFDYGYIENKLITTLQAVKNHQQSGIFKELGEADVTALVNFSMLNKTAKNCGLNSSLITQREFLIALGVEERRRALLSNKNELEKAEINSAINRLIDQDQMGDLFKCMILWN